MSNLHSYRDRNRKSATHTTDNLKMTFLLTKIKRVVAYGSREMNGPFWSGFEMVIFLFWVDGATINRTEKEPDGD